ncbi:hypothetical protein Dimus_038039 [Dionaea muscipula]
MGVIESSPCSMETAYENDDLIDSELVNTEPVSTEPISTELADAPAVGSEFVQSLPITSEPIHEESICSEVEIVHSEPLASESIDSQTINSDPIHSNAASSELIQSQPASSEPASSELIHSQPAGEELIGSQPEAVRLERDNPESPGSEIPNTQPDGTKSSVTEPVDLGMMVIEPMSSDDANEQPVNTEELGGKEPIDSEPVHPLHSHPEVVYSKAADLDTVNSEPVDSDLLDSDPVHADPTISEHVQLEQGSFEQVQLQMANSEAVHSQSLDPELVESQAVSSEPEVPEHSYPVDVLANDSQPVSSELHSEAEHSYPVDVVADDSQLVSSELHSEAEHSYPVNVVADDSQPVSSELHSEAMNAEYQTTEHPMSQSEIMEIESTHPPVTDGRHMEPIISEHADSEAVNEEFMTTEPMFTDPMSLEPDHSQPVEPELVYSQPYSSQLVQSQPLDIDYSQSLGSEYVHSQSVGTELVHLQPGSSELVLSQGLNYESVNLHPTDLGLVNSQYANSELVSSEQANPEMQPNKRRKKKSIVWEHFTIETVGNGCRRACCKVCKQSFAYSTGSKVAGTSHLKRHIAKGSCPVILRQQERNQLTPYMPKSGGTETGTGTIDPPKRRYRSSNSPYLIFDQDKCRHEIARMIIMHDYPLHIVEHPGFVAFVQNLQPRFDMVSVDTVRGDCVATYLREKQNLQKFINGLPGLICLALDVWTSSHSTSYVFLTGQFIDHDWKLHRRLLNVVMEPFPESESALSHAVATCLSYWSLENKLSSITVDQPLNETARENLRSLLSLKNSRTLNGQLLVANCIARTLSGMAVEVLAAGEHVIKKVRASVKYVKTSDFHEEKFLELKRQLQVPTEKKLALDNLTRWDTTYHMLVAASDLKEVFSCLDTTPDSEFKDALSLEEWKHVESLCTQLKLLYETASLLTEKTSPPPNIFFHEVWKIQLELARTAASDDPFVSSLAKPMQEKFKKYWEDSCLVLAIAVALDPRFKMKLVEFSFTKIFGEQAPGYIRAVDGGIHEIFHEYETLPGLLHLTPTTYGGEDGNELHVKMEQQDGGGNFLSSNGLTDFDMYIMETTSQLSKSELDQYLEESLLPRVHDFDILGWWKLNRIKYPTLSKMARDILTLPLSTVGPDLVFDTVRREMDLYRSSLRPETLEALVCAKDWLQWDPSSEVHSSGIVKMEV